MKWYEIIAWNNSENDGNNSENEGEMKAKWWWWQNGSKWMEWKR